MIEDVEVSLYREFFNYDPETGVATWLKCASNRSPIGAEILTPNASGYKSCRLRGREVTVHRVAFALMTGKIPNRIDHRDRDRTNNQWRNLRPASASQNIANAKLHRDSTTGFKGVTQVRDGRFRARIRVNYRLLHLGYFNTPEQAHTAYMRAAKKYFGEFANAY